jgi:two-component system KDP operon response regulator KdpE
VAARTREERLSVATRRILVIEDNDEGREALVRLLQLWGHEVTAAIDGRSGVEAAVADAPDVVLVDVGLPDLDGMEVVRQIRAGVPCRDAYVVAYSGFHTAAKEAVKAGCDAFVLKPGIDQLEALLARDLVRAAPQTGRKRDDVA